jgi:DtxR family Mn-dependent transcriptional regulator
MLTFTEENYLKTILLQSENGDGIREVGTNELAMALEVKPATVNHMLKRLKEKKLILNEKYGKIRLTRTGRTVAVTVVRKHRLWETFLFETLRFSWDEVHEVAEQLEHIQSEKLISRLDEFLNFPRVDPHGDPIPLPDGKIPRVTARHLSLLEPGKSGVVVGVRDTSSAFLQYLEHLSIRIGSRIKVLRRMEFDGSLEIRVGRQASIVVSGKFATSVLVG